MTTDLKAGEATARPWLRDGRTLYALHHVGHYRDGKPDLVNRFFANFSGCGQGGASEAEAEANAILAHTAVNEREGLLKQREELRAAAENILWRINSGTGDDGWADACRALEDALANAERG